MRFFLVKTQMNKTAHSLQLMKLFTIPLFGDLLAAVLIDLCVHLAAVLYPYVSIYF